MELLTLKQICESIGVSRRSIQCYEKAGLMIPSDKNKYGHLLYDIHAMHRAETIAYSARTAHPFRRNGAPFRFKLSKAQQVD